MVDSIKVQITIAEITKQKLDRLCRLKGLRRSAVVTIALDNLLREEEGRDK